MINQTDYFQTNGYQNSDYSGQQLIDVGGKGLRFFECIFNYSVIERGYFHNATFENCKFIGTRLVSCNFRSASFINCDFRYAIFSNTIIATDRIINNLPYEPNQRRDLIQTLRANAVSIGDFKANNDLLSLELKASTLHHKNVYKHLNSYYQNKYSTRERIKSFFSYLALRLEDAIWGYGLSPVRLILFALVIMIIIGAIVSVGNITETSTLAEIVKSFWVGFSNASLALLDLSLISPSAIEAHRALFAVIVAVRVTILGLLITVLYRRYAR